MAYTCHFRFSTFPKSHRQFKDSVRVTLGVYRVCSSSWSHHVNWIKIVLRHRIVSTRYPAHVLSRQVVKEVFFFNIEIRLGRKEDKTWWIKTATHRSLKKSHICHTIGRITFASAGLLICFVEYTFTDIKL
jgi:hypothetical protein